jgi:hypothetical protein
MKAKVKTKSNFKNLNGQWLKVKEMAGTRVSCEVEDVMAYNGKLTVDFHIKEIEEIQE